MTRPFQIGDLVEFELTPDGVPRWLENIDRGGRGPLVTRRVEDANLTQFRTEEPTWRWPQPTSSGREIQRSGWPRLVAAADTVTVRTNPPSSETPAATERPRTRLQERLASCGRTLSPVPMIYVAAAYSPVDGEPRSVVFFNSAYAQIASRAVADAGAMPVVPHAPYCDDIRDGAWWYDATMLLMLRCDAVYVVGGISKGVRAEIEAATKAGMPVFFGTADHERMREWVNDYAGLF